MSTKVKDLILKEIEDCMPMLQGKHLEVFNLCYKGDLRYQTQDKLQNLLELIERTLNKYGESND